MLQQRREAKIHRKESSPRPGLELITTGLWVRHTHHWATQPWPENKDGIGLKLAENKDGIGSKLGENKGRIGLKLAENKEEIGLKLA